MIKQLLVLQNGRIEDFEARMANALSAAIPSTDHIEEVRNALSVPEMAFPPFPQEFGGGRREECWQSADLSRVPRLLVKAPW